MSWEEPDNWWQANKNTIIGILFIAAIVFGIVVLFAGLASVPEVTK